jgi:hypothetical protein
MARAGHRYSLLMYTRMMDRWWPAMLLLALGQFGLAWGVRSFYPDPASEWRWMTLAGVGSLALLYALIILILRKAAYVQARPGAFHLATPFLHLNISYKRIQRTSSATINGLFPASSLSGWKQEILEPLARKTAIVVELNGYPISQQVLKSFLSPFFFKDKTPHFVLLVDDWMRFSAELESWRSGGPEEPKKPPKRPTNRSILSRLPQK